MVSISLSDLAMLAADERLAHARAIKARIRELHDRFAVRFPVYVLFTKCDLVAGFSEFFANLGKEERDQVWGMTFPLDDGKEEGGAVAHFSAEFDLLLDRLNDRVMERMQAEPDINARSLIYGFPQQFASVRDTAGEFLDEIFRPSRLETRPLLRGVYFTSGTQDGTPIDRLMGAMSGQFGLGRQAVTAFSGAGKSFFLHRAFKDVAFDEAGVVAVDARLERRQRLVHRAAYGVAGLVLVLCTAAWATSYVRNVDLIGRSGAAADTYMQQYTALAQRPPGDLSLPPLLPALATLRTMPGGYAEHGASPSALSQFGLYQGFKLGAQADAAYDRALDGLLLPRLLARLEGQMLANLGNTDFLYQALKVYLILGRKGPLDPGLVQQWMDADFTGSVADPAARQALSGHVAAMMERPLTEIPLNGPLIDQVRGILRQTPLARRSYARIIGSEEAKAAPPWRYADHTGAAGSDVLLLRSGKSLDTGVDGLYTYAGYHDIFAKLLPEVTQDVAEDSWVLGRTDQVQGDGAQIAQLRRDVLGLYLDDYVRKWDGLIADVQIKPFRTMADGLNELNTLSGPNSPLRNVFQSFATETALVATTQADKLAAGSGQLAANEARSAAMRQLGAREKRIAAMLGTVLAPGAPVVDPAQRVNDHFKWLTDFVGTPEKPGPIEAVLTKMGQIYQSFSQVAASPNASQAMLGAAASNSGASLAAQLDTLGKSMPKAVAGDGPHRQPEQQPASPPAAPSRRSPDAWASKVLPLCQAALTNRYPLVASSTTDVPMDDFIRLMAPGGMIDKFFADYLKPFVDTSAKPWQLERRRQQPAGAFGQHAGAVPARGRHPRRAVRRRRHQRRGQVRGEPGGGRHQPRPGQPRRGRAGAELRAWTGAADAHDVARLRRAEPGAADLLAGERVQHLGHQGRPVGAVPPAGRRAGQQHADRPGHLQLHFPRRQRGVPVRGRQRGQPVHPAGTAPVPLPSDALAAACAITARASHTSHGLDRTGVGPSLANALVSAATGAAVVSSGNWAVGGTLQRTWARTSGSARRASATTAGVTIRDGFAGRSGSGALPATAGGRSCATVSSLRCTASRTRASGCSRGSAPKLCFRRAMALLRASRRSTVPGSSSAGIVIARRLRTMSASRSGVSGWSRSRPVVCASASSGLSSLMRRISGSHGASGGGGSGGGSNRRCRMAARTLSAASFRAATACQAASSSRRSCARKAGRRLFKVSITRARRACCCASLRSSAISVRTSSAVCTRAARRESGPGPIGGSAMSASSQAGSGFQEGAGRHRASSQLATVWTRSPASERAGSGSSRTVSTGFAAGIAVLQKQPMCTP